MNLLWCLVLTVLCISSVVTEDQEPVEEWGSEDTSAKEELENDLSSRDENANLKDKRGFCQGKLGYWCKKKREMEAIAAKKRGFCSGKIGYWCKKRREMEAQKREEILNSELPAEELEKRGFCQGKLGYWCRKKRELEMQADFDDITAPSRAMDELNKRGFCSGKLGYWCRRKREFEVKRLEDSLRELEGTDKRGFCSGKLGYWCKKKRELLEATIKRLQAPEAEDAEEKREIPGKKVSEETLPVTRGWNGCKLGYWC